MVAEREEANATHLVKVVIHPVADRQPFMVANVHRDRRIVLAPIRGKHQVVLELLDRRHVVAEHRVLRATHREREHVGSVRLHHAVLDREALRTHELRQRVLLVGTHRTHVVLRVAWVDPTGRIHELRNRARRLHRGDGHRGVDAQLLGPLGVGLDRVLAELGQPLCSHVARLAQHLVVHDAGHRHAQQALLFGVALPHVADVAVVGQRRLERAHDRGHFDLVHQVFKRVTGANDHLGQVAQPRAAQDDLAARVGTELVVRVTAIELGSLLLGGYTVEDAALARLGLDEGHPLFEEDLHVRLFGICRRVIRQRALAVVHPPLATLGHAHAIVGQIGQGDQRGAAYATDYDDVRHLTHEIVALDTVELAPRSLLEQGRGEVEQVNQRLGSGRATTERLELGTGGSDLGYVPLRDLASVKHGHQLAEGRGPADLAVLHGDQGVALVEVLRHGREVVDELALDRKADAGAAHQDVEDLVEGAHVVDGHIGAVEPGHLVLVERRAGGHEGAHGGHGAECADGLVDAVGGVQLGKACGEEVRVSGDSLLPSLTSLLTLQPPRITRQVDVFLKLSRKRFLLH